MHTVVGFIQYDTLLDKALWFFSAGITLCFAGIINFMDVLAASKGRINTLSIIANSIITVFAVVLGYHTMGKHLINPMAWLLIANSFTALIINIRRN